MLQVREGAHHPRPGSDPLSRELTIQGFDTRQGSPGLYVRFTLNGKDFHKQLSTVKAYCEQGSYGLTAADKRAFTAAHERYLISLELGRPLPFKGPIHKL